MLSDGDSLQRLGEIQIELGKGPEVTVSLPMGIDSGSTERMTPGEIQSWERDGYFDPLKLNR